MRYGEIGQSIFILNFRLCAKAVADNEDSLAAVDAFATTERKEIIMVRIPQPQQQARILAKLLADQGITLKHQAALDIVAQLSGHRNWQVMQSTPAPTHAVEEETPKELEVAGFNVHDVLSVRPDLSLEEAEEVLHFAAKYYDASIGLNWEILESYSYQWSNKVYVVEGFISSPVFSGPVVVRLVGGAFIAGTLEGLKKARLQGVRETALAVSFPQGSVLRVPKLPEIDISGESALMGGESDALQQLACEMRASGTPLEPIPR
jgi:hypothetical protein